VNLIIIWRPASAGITRYSVYDLQERGIEVRSRAETKNNSFQGTQTGFEAHSASYSFSNLSSAPMEKKAEAWS
jgi:hypothetical protein